MQLSKNRKGIYEFILTKSIMLIFILALVGVFATLNSRIQEGSAKEIIQAEADSIAKKIDNLVNSNIESGETVIHLKRYLEVGWDIEPYVVQIDSEGRVLVQFVQYPYQGITGVSQFGLDLNRITGVDQISCEVGDIREGVSISIRMDVDYNYVPEGNQLYKTFWVEIDASEDCTDRMVFERAYRVD